MALDVTFCNKFGTQISPVVMVYIGESENDSNPIKLKPGENPGQIALSNNEFRFIWADRNCEIRISASADAPNVQILLSGSGSKWKFTNIGTNTSAQVDVGPDGQ